MDAHRSGKKEEQVKFKRAVDFGPISLSVLFHFQSHYVNG